MIGGEQDVFEKHEQLLKDISSSLKFVGPVENAANIKALVNMVMNANTAALAEGLGLGEALGIDLGMLREIFSQTGANSRVLETDGEDMVLGITTVFSPPPMRQKTVELQTESRQKKTYPSHFP